MRVQFQDEHGVVTQWIDVVSKSSTGVSVYQMPCKHDEVRCAMDAKGKAGCLIGSRYNAKHALAEPVEAAKLAPLTSQVANFENVHSRPDEQQTAFLAAIDDARQKAESTDSGVTKDAVRRERAKAICHVLPSGKIHDWTGELVQVATDGAGQGILSVNVGSDVHFSTIDNAFSGLADSTLLDANSELFRKATSISEGQRVLCSGNFLTAADNTECKSELNLILDQSLDGSLDAPVFVFNFSDVRVLSD